MLHNSIVSNLNLEGGKSSFAVLHTENGFSPILFKCLLDN
jgi:hypothetical protein